MCIEKYIETLTGLTLFSRWCFSLWNNNGSSAGCFYIFFSAEFLNEYWICWKIFHLTLAILATERIFERPRVCLQIRWKRIWHLYGNFSNILSMEKIKFCHYNQLLKLRRRYFLPFKKWWQILMNSQIPFSSNLQGYPRILKNSLLTKASPWRRNVVKLQQGLFGISRSHRESSILTFGLISISYSYNLPIIY